MPETRIAYLPPRVEGLVEIAMNLAWSWNRRARFLFRSIDDRLWQETRHNPLALLRRADPARVAGCASDPAYLELYDSILAEIRSFQSADGTWFANTWPGLDSRPVAYFCAEFGLHNSVPIYSGGLGVLAGDHCKASSDLGVPLVGVGLFYRHGYFDQHLRLDGWQEDTSDEFDVLSTPLVRLSGPNGEPWVTAVDTSGHPVHVGAWRIMAGRVPIYLLDTDFEENREEDRSLVSRLYSGGATHRLRQEWLLGVGGVRVLRALGIDPGVWHANEGHAAFMLVERLREHLAGGASYEDAVARVRAASVFTTHTPVPAGHDFFSVEQMAACSGAFWDAMGISRDAFMHLGEKPGEPGVFHMTVAATRLSARVNGVSRRHGQVSRGLWRGLWPDRPAEAVPISHVTNGVHLETWMAAPILRLVDEALGDGHAAHDDDPAAWDAVLGIDPGRLWEAHLSLKRVLLRRMREEARWRYRDRWREAAHVVGAGTLLDPEALTIGFARRFATYKRANLLFHDLERLKRLVTDRERPVQVIFAGKAHPADEPGKEVLQTVYEFTRDPTLEGRVAFLEDYDLHLAHLLVQGVDVWLNLPRVPLEASGTSGMKAALNGVPQLGTLDGWWQEGYDGQSGWAIPPASDESDPDASDARHLYALLEEQVVPLFYTRAGELPLGWTEKMRYAIRLAASRFTAGRMVRQYVNDFYVPAVRGDMAGGDPPTA